MPLIHPFTKWQLGIFVFHIIYEKYFDIFDLLQFGVMYAYSCAVWVFVCVCVIFKLNARMYGPIMIPFFVLHFLQFGRSRLLFEGKRNVSIILFFFLSILLATKMMRTVIWCFPRKKRKYSSWKQFLQRERERERRPTNYNSFSPHKYKCNLKWSNFYFIGLYFVKKSNNNFWEKLFRIRIPGK